MSIHPQHLDELDSSYSGISTQIQRNPDKAEKFIERCAIDIQLLDQESDNLLIRLEYLKGIRNERFNAIENTVKHMKIEFPILICKPKTIIQIDNDKNIIIKPLTFPKK